MAVLRRRYLRVGRRSTLQVKLYVDMQHEAWFTEEILEVRGEKVKKRGFNIVVQKVITAIRPTLKTRLKEEHEQSMKAKKNGGGSGSSKKGRPQRMSLTMRYLMYPCLCFLSLNDIAS